MMSNINDISRKYTSDDQASSVCEQYSQSKVPHLSSHHGNLESNFVARYAKKKEETIDPNPGRIIVDSVEAMRQQPTQAGQAAYKSKVAASFYGFDGQSFLTE